MFSHLTSRVIKELAILTLLVGVLAMPISPLLAEEMGVAQVSITPAQTEISPTETPAIPTVVESAVTCSPDQVASSASSVEAQTSVPADEVMATEVLPMNTLVTVVSQIETNQTTENSFTTLGTDDIPPVVVDSNNNEALSSEENSFQTAEGLLVVDDSSNLAISEENAVNDILTNSDTLAISEEQNKETIFDLTDDPWTKSNENFVVTLESYVDTGATSDENSFQTLVVTVDTLTVGGENAFTTLSTEINTLAISGENAFTTEISVLDTLAISVENTFTTLSGPTNFESAISDEKSFTTLSSEINTLAISGENAFTTAQIVDNDTLAISAEFNFNTLSNPTEDLAVSDENSFTTLSSGNDTLVVSGENTFTTLTNGGGGGGGGGTVLGEKVYHCPVYLKKFIKYGSNNDRREVAKLQAFLKVFEGFKGLKVTGVYDYSTYEAVKIFQSRYLRDVLRPWGISHSTGFVYITTRLTINRIYCNQDTANNLRFRQQVEEEYYRGLSGIITTETATSSLDEGGYYLVPTTTPTTTPFTTQLLAGLGELLDFIVNNFCWLFNLLLLILIFFLLWLLWQTERGEEIELAEEESPHGSLEIEEKDQIELAKLAAEEEEKIEKLDNNPWQEAIILGPETTPLEANQTEEKTLS